MAISMDYAKRESRWPAVLAGGIGGATPTAVVILALEPEKLILLASLPILTAYLIKIGGFFIFSALWVYFHEEMNKWKAFQLGLLVPAVFLGGAAQINLNEHVRVYEESQKQLQKLQSGESTDVRPQEGNESSFTFFIESAYAEASASRGEHRTAGVFAKFWYGLSGNLTNGWFVVVGSHKQELEAKKQAEELRDGGWDVRIGEPDDWNGYHAVLIGSYLPKESAMSIRALAVSEGLPKDTFLWKITRPFF